MKLKTKKAEQSPAPPRPEPVAQAHPRSEFNTKADALIAPSSEITSAPPTPARVRAAAHGR